MTQLYQSEALIGATLLSFLLRLFLLRIQSCSQEPPGLDGVCTCVSVCVCGPPQVQRSTMRTKIASRRHWRWRRSRRTLLEHRKSRKGPEWAEPIRPSLMLGPRFLCSSAQLDPDECLQKGFAWNPHLVTKRQTTCRGRRETLHLFGFK